MKLEQIKVKADLFFDFPTDNKDHVTTTSAILFARHCADETKIMLRTKEKREIFEEGIFSGLERAAHLVENLPGNHCNWIADDIRKLAESI